MAFLDTQRPMGPRLQRRPVLRTNGQSVVESRPIRYYWTFLGRWLIAGGATAAAFLITPNVRIISYETLAATSLTLGLLNALVPHISVMIGSTASMQSFSLVSLGVNILVLYSAQMVDLGVAAMSIPTIILAAVTVTTISLFATMALDGRLIIH